MRIQYLTGCLVAVVACILVIGCGGAREEIAVLPEETAVEAEPTEPQYEFGVIVETPAEPVQLTSEEADNGIGSFHPDGELVVFQSNRDGKWQIYELDLGDQTERILIASEANDENPVWTPDGEALLFVSDRDGSGGEWERDIYSYDPTDETVIRMTDDPCDDWFPVPLDDDSFLFLSEREADAGPPTHQRENALYRGFLDGSQPIQIVGTQIDPSAPAQFGDGRFIVRTPDGELIIFSIISGTSEQLTPTTLRCGGSAVNPEMGWLAFCAREEGSYGLYLLDLENNIIQRLLTDGGDVLFPQFSTDGGSILYTSEVNGHYQLFNLVLVQ